MWNFLLFLITEAMHPEQGIAVQPYINKIAENKYFSNLTFSAEEINLRLINEEKAINFEFELFHNEFVIHDSYHEILHFNDRTDHFDKDVLAEEKWRHYYGNLAQNAGFPASFYFHDIIEGNFAYHNGTVKVETINGTVVIHLQDKNVNFEKISANFQIFDNFTRASQRSKRLDFQSEYKNIVELYVVIAKDVVDEINKNITLLRTQLAKVFTGVASTYRVVEIYVVVKTLEVWVDYDRFDTSGSNPQRFTRFVGYIVKQKHISRDCGIFIETTSKGSGLGYVNDLCNTKCIGIVQGGVTGKNGINSLHVVIAHELGHNLGLNHVGKECGCYHNCLMEKYNYVLNFKLSHCSIKVLKKQIKSRKWKCTHNLPSKVDLPVCGNFFVEAGEECDCGTPKECKSKCCDPHTCKFTKGSECFFGACCDIKTCKFQQSGKLCRKANDKCDFPEFCVGDDHFCPVDVHYYNSHACPSRDCGSRDCLDVAPTVECGHNGIENNKGHCHCKPGYKPPGCFWLGNGGSVDSGSYPNLHVESIFFVPLFFATILLPIGLLCSLPGFAFYKDLFIKMKNFLNKIQRKKLYYDRKK